jgi:hypothetical protein
MIPARILTAIDFRKQTQRTFPQKSGRDFPDVMRGS